MLQWFSHRLLFLPLLVLVGFIAVYCVVEFKRLSSDSMIRSVINEPLPSMVHDMHVAAMNLKTVYQKYRPSYGQRPETTQALRDALDSIIKIQHEITAYLEKSALDANEHLQEIDRINIVATLVRKLDENFSIYECKDEGVWLESQEKLESVIKEIEDLHVLIRNGHLETVNKILKQISNDEENRSLLLVFVLVSGLILVLVLMDGVYHYKNNAERAMAAEKCNALFAAALQNTRVGILIRDMRAHGRPAVFANDAFTHMTGYAFDEIHGDTSEFLFGWDTDPKTIALFRRAISLRETTIMDVMLYRKDGSPFWCEWHLTPIMGDDGALAYFVSLFNDTTGLRQTQEDLIQAKATAEHASAVKSTFLAMMSHEIRTPINGILGVFKLLETTRLDEEQKHLIGVAKTSSNILHGIINDILDYAKMEAGKIDIVVEPFDIRSLVDEVVNLGRSLLGDKNLIVDYAVLDSVPQMVMGDKGRLRQIILNLVSNAIKFTDAGFVRVRVFPLLEQDIDGKPGHLMRFEIQDTGLGIAAEDQAKLFQEFSQVDKAYTRRFGGTGLGLAICKRLVSLMGGEINVESQPGKGSRFWFILPFITAQDSDAHQHSMVGSASQKDGKRDLSSVHLLLVEDNDTNRLIARRYIERLGIQIDEAVDGQMALNKATEYRYDIIFMDVSMPVMDGLTATRHIRATNDHNAVVPIIALTAHAMESDKQACFDAGMNDYLSKPIDESRMLAMFYRWLNTGFAVNEVALAKEPVENKSAPVFDDLTPVFDPNVLLRMQDDLGGSAVDQVTHVYLQDSAKRMEQLTEDKEFIEIRDVAHTLKSCSGNCGLKRLSLKMAELEQAAGKQDKELVARLLPEAQKAYTEARQVLEKERGAYVE